MENEVKSPIKTLKKMNTINPNSRKLTYFELKNKFESIRSEIE